MVEKENTLQMYGVSLDDGVMQMMQEWNENDPIDEWECKRNLRIKKAQGYSNPIVVPKVSVRLALELLNSKLGHKAQWIGI